MMKRPDRRLVALCCAVYFTSYLTRKCYEASILAICDDTGLARTAAGLAGTATVALYGGGQLVTGWLADRIDPRRIVFAALLLTAACNAAIPAAASAGTPWLVAVNATNGFAQAMFWPPLVKIFAESLAAERYKGAVFAVNVAANAAIVAVFALVAASIRLANWRLSFALAAAIAIAMAAIWWRGCNRRQPISISRTRPRTASIDSTRPQSIALDRTRPQSTALAAAMLLPVVLAIVCMGAMRDGIETWAPTIVKDVYGLGASGSTLSVAILPFFAVASMAAARRLRAALGDETRAALALFGIGLGCSVALHSTGGAALFPGLPLFALLSASMHGANLMLVCELPGTFAGGKRVGTVSGILNAAVYAGASLSIYGFAAIHARNGGWTAVFAVWVAVLAVGIALLALARRISRGAQRAMSGSGSTGTPSLSS